MPALPVSSNDVEIRHNTDSPKDELIGSARDCHADT